MDEIKISEELRELLDLCNDIRYQRKSIAIHGRAGTGKTTALLLCQQHLAEMGMKVLPLAFSKRGVQRFNEKLYAMYGDHSGLRECVSMESFVLNCLKDHSLEKRWQSGKIDARLDDAEAELKVMRHAVAALNERYADTEELELLPERESDLRQYLELVSNIKISMAFEERPFNRLEQNGYLTEDDEADIGDALIELKLPPYAFSLFVRYENCRRDATYLGRGDAAYDLAREPDAIARWCRASGMNVVLVDEFHDTKAAHFQTIEALIDHDISVIAMGDPAQDIFEFRGIAPYDALLRFSEQAKHVLTLTRSYRYGREIAKVVEAQLAQAEASVIPLKPATHRSAHIPLMLPLSLPMLCRQLLARAAKEELDEGEYPIAILTPSNQDAIPVMRELLLAGIPVQAGPGMPRCDLVDEMQFMRIIARLAGWASRPFSASDALALSSFISLPKLALTVLESAQLEDLFIDRYGAQRGKKHEVTYRTDSLGDVLSLLRTKLGINTEVPFTSKSLEVFLERLDIRKHLYNKAVTQAAHKGADMLLNDASSRLLLLGGDAFINELELLRERSMQGRGAERVLVSSVLQAKGMEWRVVIMPPLAWATNRNQSSMERRERYVACSRAKIRLYY